MQPFKKILAAIDFSPSSDEALRQAHERAASTGATLAVCHIVPDELRSNLLFPHFSQIMALRVPVDMERAAEAVSSRVAEITGRSGTDVTVMADHGKPYAEILTKAEKWNADLIVIGSHGMTSASGVLLGSVTHKIIRYAHCAVLIARPGKGSGPILGCTDFSDPALPAVAAAAHEARRTGRRLVLAHSLEFGWTAAGADMAFGAPALTLTPADIAEIEKQAREKLLAALKRSKADGGVHVANGPAGPALVMIAEKLASDLVVVGTRGRTGLSRVLLGSVAETVAAQAHCSVLIVRLNTAEDR